MTKKLYLLDGMPLIYRAHFAFMRNPIFTSTGMNTSAVFGYINTLLHILDNEQPSHVALALDTPGPTERHHLYPEYKAQRQAVPEDIIAAIPYVEKVTRAMGIPVIPLPGYEADDIIGTLARRGEAAGCEVYMVTPDKDFAQLVTDQCLIYKPGRQGNEREILDREAICKKWNVKKSYQRG